MASTAEAARLTEAHRLAQARLGAKSVEDMVTLWSLIDPNRLDSTVPAWLRAALPIIQSRRRTSAQLAAGYLRAFRAMELPDAPLLTPTLVSALDDAAAATSLTVTGPVSLKRAMRAGRDIARAAETAKANTARAAMRHALAGGRDTIAATVEADRYAIGYRRVTSGDACDFCSMLAGRGAVYSGPTSTFDAHDGCSCASEPVYSDE